MPIRPARPDDIPQIAALEHALFGAGAYPATFLRQAVELWPRLVLVFADGDPIDGYVLGAPASTPGEFWVLALAVHPDAQGKGLGRALAAAAVDNLRDLGASQVRLTVHPDNGPALRLYRALGFEEAGLDPGYFGPGEPRLHLVLEVTPR